MTNADHKESHVLSRLIGRQDAVSKIEEALNNVDSTPQVIYFYGIAGIGKTHLLRSVRSLRRRRRENGLEVFTWSGVIDLYHPERRNQTGLEDALVRTLDDLDHQYFRGYREKRQKLEDNVQAGSSSDIIQAVRKEVTDEFIANYTRLSKRQPIVLTFDTVELLRHEADVAQQVCGISSSQSALIEWFLTVLPKLSNTVVIFAGRPDSEWEAILSEKFGSSFESLALGSLSFEETNAFLDLLIENHPHTKEQLSSELRQQIFELTQGRPIYISLLVDLLNRETNVEISTIFPVPIVLEENMALPSLVGQAITRHLTNLEGDFADHGRVFHFLAYAHQGLDAKLLVYLLDEEWSDLRAEKAIAELAQYTFVKTHQEEKMDKPEQIFFHDELFDLFDRHYCRFPLEDGIRTFTKFRNYYRQKYEQLYQQVQNSGPGRSKKDKEQRRRLVQQLEDVTVPLLYYELQVEPQNAYYHNYWWWSLEAIRANKIEYDYRLRSVVLHFIKQYLEKGSPVYHDWLASQLDLEAVYRDSAVRWIRRLIAQNRSVDAQVAAKQTRYSVETGFDWNLIDDELYKAHLLCTWGEAIYTKPTEETFALMKFAEHMLEQLTADKLNRAKDEIKRRAWIQAVNFNNLGYANRVLNHLTNAYPYYQKALRAYRGIHVLSETATTTRNIAFVYARLGAIDEAIVLVKDAISIHQKVGEVYNEALGYNTYSLIMLMDGKAIRARALNTQAELLLSEIGLQDSRAYALVQLAKGTILRECANLVQENVFSSEEGEKLLEGAEAALRIAEKLSREGSIDALDTAIELGRLYRDWMAFHELLRTEPQVKQRFLRLAQVEYAQAFKVAEQRRASDEIANILQDLALLHELSNDLQQAWYYINEAEARIPAEYKPQKGIGFTPIAQPINQFLFILGDVYLTKARILQKEKDDPNFSLPRLSQEERFIKQTQEQLLGAACYEKASPFPSWQLQGMRTTREAIYNHLKIHGQGVLLKLRDNIHELFRDYNLTEDLAHILRYMNDTLGALGFGDEESV